HLSHFLALAEAETIAPFVPFAPQQLDRLDAEWLNLVAALSWLEAAGETTPFQQLAARLGWYWFVRGSVREGRDWLQRAFALGGIGSPAALADIALALGYVALLGTNDELTEASLADALNRCRRLANVRGEIAALIGLGALGYKQGDYDRAIEVLRAALALARA